MTNFATRLLLATCVGALAYACGDDAPSDDGRAHDHDAAAHGDADDHTDEDVPCDNSYPSFTPGMSVKAGALTVKVQAIDPEPPRQRMRNDWVLQVVDGNGQPLDGLKFTNASTYMPVHRHGGKTKPVSAPTGQPGTYGLDNLDFIMRGPWQVLFDVDQNGTNLGTATIQICVE